MTANWLSDPSSGGTQHKYFAEVLMDGTGTEDGTTAVGRLGSYRGEPALVLSRQDMDNIAAPYHNVLVGRFAFSRPPMEVISRFFTALGLKG